MSCISCTFFHFLRTSQKLSFLNLPNHPGSPFLVAEGIYEDLHRGYDNAEIDQGEDAMAEHVFAKVCVLLMVGVNLIADACGEVGGKWVGNSFGVDK